MMKRLDHQDGRTISYSADIPALERFYDRQFELIKNGNTDLVTLELMMLGKALDFIQMAQKKLGVSLDTSESSVSRLEEILDACCRGIVQDDLFAEENGSIAKSMSAYLGVLILANIGGKWEDTESGAALSVNGRMAYVDEYIEKRLLGLSELSVVDYYQSVRLVRE